MCAALWAAAELLTAFFLFSQFQVTGRLSLALIASAYACTSALTLPYVIFFPNVLPLGRLTLPDMQTSGYLWTIWHCAFATMIGITFLIDPDLKVLVIPRARIARTLCAVAAAIVASTATITYLVYHFRAHLRPIVDSSNHFTWLYSHALTPAVVLTSLLAFAIVAFRLKHAAPLQVWIAVALLSSISDGILNEFSAGRYTISWYVGKLESLGTASIVLCMLLYETAAMYRGLLELASIDPLTGLQNRRTLGADLGVLIERQRVASSGLAMLVIDLDHFKSINDEYGHAAGDDVLRSIADIIRSAVFRPGDMTARYGGEEFVVVLPNTSLAGARAVAERIRQNIAERTIVVENGRAVRLT
ncbi:MAG: GGDEF domain-containing protein, partial [Candidatus Eremiobacteraeota bacterium]|nr:GGDEF domain-containing protein [Candidatus Eremiobacteraeota bacterium]